MPFQEQTTGVLVLSAMGGGWETWEDEPSQVESGWDTRRVLFAKDFHGPTSLVNICAAFPLGMRLQGGSFWVQGVRAARVAGGIYSAEIIAKGLAASRQPKVSVGSTVEQATGPLNPEDEDSKEKFASLAAAPTIEIEYISMVEPHLGRVGQQGTPPWSLAGGVLPASFGGLELHTTHYPWEWVLMGLPSEKLVGVNVWLVREVWQWIHPVTP
jgi:hypothetical protein